MILLPTGSDLQNGISSGLSPKIIDETLKINHLEEHGLSYGHLTNNSSKNASVYNQNQHHYPHLQNQQQLMGMILKSNITPPSVSSTYSSQNQFFNQMSLVAN